jgi:3-methyladenine DNA glycosylase Mpg
MAGIALMQQRRHTHTLRQLCNGPGKLTQAMHITPLFNGASFLAGPLTIVSADHFGGTVSLEKIITTPRVGIVKGKDTPLRFYLQGMGLFQESKPPAVHTQCATNRVEMIRSVLPSTSRGAHDL